MTSLPCRLMGEKNKRGILSSFVAWDSREWPQQHPGHQYARLDPTELALYDMLVGPQVPLR
jgi:hypothetical protein